MKSLFLALILLLAYQVKSAVSLKPPRLNISDSAVFTSSSSGFQPFTVRCEGQADLHWNWTTSLHPDDEIVQIDKFFHIADDYSYISTLTIKEPDIIDTGFYYCYYSDVSQLETDNERAARSYVYFHDGSNGLVRPNEYEHKIITTADKLVLDCRTTLPDITVDLYKNDEKVEVSGHATIIFDPKIGYVLRNLKVQDAGQYKCTTPFDNFTTLVEIIKSGSDVIPTPAIEWAPNQHFLVGQDLVLNCSLIWSKDVAFHWTLPNPNAVYNTHKSEVVRAGSMYKVGTLHVFNVTLRDSGYYKCEVSGDQATPNEVSEEIHIKETMKPFINITSVPEVRIMEGEMLKWKAVIHTYPTNPTIIYRNYKGDEVIETDRVTTEHNMNNAESWLRIENATVTDFGNYTIEVISSDNGNRDSKTIRVYVKSKPYVSIYGIPPYVTTNKSIRVTCNLRGYPIPEVEWTFQKCPTGKNSCSSAEKIFLDNATESNPDPGNIKRVSGSFLPLSSGFLTCNGTNSHGQGSNVRSVSISDIGGNFVFKHIGENKTTEIKKLAITLALIENDNFYLECGAVKFSYGNVTLSGLGMEVKEKTSDYSVVKYIESAKVTSDFEGNFTCTSKLLDTGKLESREITFKVLKEARVEFTENANMREGGEEREVQENKGFQLNCTVTGMPKPMMTWYKDGIPLTRNSDFFDETTLLSKDQQSIEFHYIFKEKHVGTYTCEAKNRLNSKQASLTISVPVPGLSIAGKIGLAFAIIGIVILIVVVVFLVRRVKEERKFRKSFRKNELYLFEKGNIGQLNPDCTADEQAELLPYSPEWEVKRDDITLGRQLGAGAFGRVLKAVVTDLCDYEPKTTVALKMCKSQSDQSQIYALTRELKVMIHLGKHLNIVNLMGANTVNVGKGELWILVEYCRYGNLLTFMHRHRKNFINQINPMTGKIDPLKIVQDVTSPLSPSSQGPRFGYQTTPITDMDGYLAPTSSKFNLGSVPAGRNPSSPPQSPTSVTGSSNGSFRGDGPPQQYADNPVYRAGLNRSVSDSPQGDLNMNRMTSNTSGGSRISDARSSDQRSAGYYRDNHQIVNTDMTVLQSVTSPLSPSPHFPLSPTDSSHISDIGVDSQGNPFTFDSGQIPGINAPFTTSDLVSWGWQVAQGMDYLMRRKVLHGDLAARNLLLADNNVVKISDFGLSRDMYKKDIYMKKGDDLMPIKWMSIEAIRDRIFSVQSDVWAYGVTLWELFTLGSTPYPGIEVNKDFLTFLEDGNRMDRPKYANQEIYNIILDCWRTEPQERPTFSISAERLGVLMLPDIRGQYITMNDPYMLMNEERFRNETDYLNMLSSPDFDNLNRKDDANLHYVNLPKDMDGNRESNYLRMQAPDVVGYSRVGINRTSESEGQAVPPSSHYLPMTSTRGSDSPMIDVFSPRPIEDTRFSFCPEEEEKVRPADLLEKDEEIPSSPTEQATENSSLIGDSRSDTIENLKENSEDDIEKKLARNSEDESDLPYVNLVTHGTDYVNM